MADFLQIGNKTYTTQPLPVEVGLPTFVRVSKMMGPGFARLLADPNFRKQDVTGAEFRALVADLFTRLDDPGLMPTVATLMDNVLEDGKPMAFRWKTEFSGKLATMAKILFFAIQQHFGDFLSASAGPASSPGATQTAKN